MPETIRCFLAVETSEAVRRSLEELVTRLDLPHFHVRWVQPKNMHLTLRFLGDITERDVFEVSRAAHEAVIDVPPFRVRFRGLGTFPPAGNPRVVWMGLEDERPVVRLEREVSRRLSGSGLPSPDKPFRAHLTLGRVKSQRGIQELKKHLERNRAVETEEMAVERISLVRSVLRPSGPLHTVLDRFELGGGRTGPTAQQEREP